jgi:hypothetical protein
MWSVRSGYAVVLTNLALQQFTMQVISISWLQSIDTAAVHTSATEDTRHIVAQQQQKSAETWNVCIILEVAHGALPYSNIMRQYAFMHHPEGRSP